MRYLTNKDVVTKCVVSDDSTDEEDVLNDENTISHSAALQSVVTLDYMGERGFDYGDITVVRKIYVNTQQEINKQLK